MDQRVAVIVSSIPSDYFGIKSNFKPLADRMDLKFHWVLPQYSERVNRSPFIDTEHFLPLSDSERMADFIGALVGDETQQAQLLFISEYEIELVAAVGERLNMPAISPSRAKIIRDKLIMKDVAARGGIRVPNYRRLSARSDVNEMLETHSRVVIKPVLGTGSVNTHFIDHETQLDQLEQLVYDGSLEVEEYINGPMYHIDAVVRDGVLVLLEIGQYVSPVALYRLPGLHATVYSLDAELRRRVQEYLRKVIEAFDIADDVIHLEVFEEPSGALVFCELALRPGGGGIPQCIEEKYGVNLFEEHLLAQLRIPSRFAKQDFMSVEAWSAKTTGLFWRYSGQRGTVGHVTPLEQLASDRIFFSKMNVKAGAKVGVSRFAGLPLALFGISGTTEAEVFAEIRRLDEGLVVELEPS